MADIDGNRIRDVVALTGDSIWVARAFPVGLEVFRHVGYLSERYVAGYFRIADIDGDGRSDLIHQVSGGRYLARFAMPDGSFGLERVIEHHGEAEFPGTFKFGDFNGDGRADMMFHGPENRFWLSLSLGISFANPSKVMDWEGSVSDRYGATRNWVHYPDLNGDGINDYAFARTVSGLSLFLSNGNGGFSSMGTSADGINVNSPWFFSDFNADGKEDLFFQLTELVINGSVATIRYTNFIRHSAGFGLHPKIQTMPGNFFKILACDADGNGSQDLLFVDFAGKVYFAPSGLDARMVLTLPVVSGVACSDLNGDEKDDLLYWDRAGQLFTRLSTGRF